MRADDSFVDLSNPFIVEQSLVAEKDVENKKGRTTRHTFVAVQFINSDQMPLWTNYSRYGGTPWLRKDMKLSAAEKLRRDGVLCRAASTASHSAAMSQQSAALDGAASTASPSAVSAQELEQTYEQEYEWVE